MNNNLNNQMHDLPSANSNNPYANEHMDPRAMNGPYNHYNSPNPGDLPHQKIIGLRRTAIAYISLWFILVGSIIATIIISVTSVAVLVSPNSFSNLPYQEQNHLYSSVILLIFFTAVAIITAISQFITLIILGVQSAKYAIYFRNVSSSDSWPVLVWLGLIINITTLVAAFMILGATNRTLINRKS